MLREPWRSIVVSILTALLTILGGMTVFPWRGCGDQPGRPKPEPKPTPDPVQAIGKVAMKSGYCSATTIGPPHEGRYTVVSAAHCFGSVGEQATYYVRTTNDPVVVTVIAISRKSDIAILRTEIVEQDLPWILVAKKTPEEGSPIWHSGFGIDHPGNLEEGTVLASPNSNDQVKYRLSVSPGDSGGGICLDESGRLLSPVCCTTCLGCVGDVWGGSPEKIQRMLSSPVSYMELSPIQMPNPP